MSKTKKYLADSLAATLDSWIREAQLDDDELEMWVHDELAKQMAAACVLILDACRANQKFVERET